MMLVTWYRARNRGASAHEHWEHGRDHEVRYWKKFLAKVDPDHFRLDPQRSIMEDSDLASVVRLIDKHDIAVLDVGAGPLTPTGKTYPGKNVTLIAVDPLAGDYDRLLAEAQIDPPCRTLECAAESLTDRFEEDSFDVAISDNALDHSFDPALAIDQMLAVTRPGGFVLLRHSRNEADKQSYVGMHQWNFDIDGGHFVISNAANPSRDMTNELRARGVSVDCNLRDDWVVCVLHKPEATE